MKGRAAVGRGDDDETIEALLARLRGAGVELTAEAGGAIAARPVEALSERDRERLAERAAEVVARLRAEADATTSPGVDDAPRAEEDDPVRVLEEILAAEARRDDDHERARFAAVDARARREMERLREDALAVLEPGRVRAMAAAGRLSARDVRDWHRAYTERLRRIARGRGMAAIVGALRSAGFTGPVRFK